MMRPRDASALTLKVFLLILANEVIDSAAQIFMKKGLPHAPVDFLHPHEIAQFFFGSAGSADVLIGISIYALNFFVWIAVLSQIDLSVAVPLTSVNYVMLPVLAIFFLHEKIGWLHWLGIGFIVLGVYFISKNPQNAKKGAPT